MPTTTTRRRYSPGELQANPDRMQAYTLLESEEPAIPPLPIADRIIAHIQDLASQGILEVSRADIQQATSAGRSTTSRVLAMLTHTGQLRRVGGSKFGRCFYAIVGLGDNAKPQEGYRTDLLAAVGHEGGIQALMAAVLAAAVLDLQGDREKCEDARKWFRAKSNGNCFGFRAICEHLEIDADWFLANLKRKPSWREGP